MSQGVYFVFLSTWFALGFQLQIGFLAYVLSVVSVLPLLIPVCPSVKAGHRPLLFYYSEVICVQPNLLLIPGRVGDPTIHPRRRLLPMVANSDWGWNRQSPVFIPHQREAYGCGDSHSFS